MDLRCPPPAAIVRGCGSGANARKRLPFSDLSNDESRQPPLRRQRLGQDLCSNSPLENRLKPVAAGQTKAAVEDVEVQRFSLVSRGAPPTVRRPARRTQLLAPPALVAQIGEHIQVCNCSEHPADGERRLCRRDTECHSEFALLHVMNRSFEAECPERSSASLLVCQACCRQKSAYFILGPGATTVGYVAAVVTANRRAMRAAAGGSTRAERRTLGRCSSVASEADAEGAPGAWAFGDAPTILQIYVEPEFRRRGYGASAVAMLLRNHSVLLIDAPTPAVLRLLERLGFAVAGAQHGAEGRPLARFVRGSFVN